MDITLLEIPTELLEAANLTPAQAKTELAIRLYQQHKLNEEQARALAGDPKAIEDLAWGSHASGHINLDDFISWASHDLKSPLNSIIGFTRVVIKGMDGPVNEAQAADLTTAFTNSQRMLSLINNLVDMARLNMGQIQMRLVETDVTKVLNEALEKWQTANAAKRVQSTINISNPALNIDAGYMRQIIASLLTYAAMRITAGALTLSVQDNAAGIEIKIQSMGEKSRDKSEMDSAMFDFICAALIKLHGGVFNPPQETEDGVLLSFSVPR